ncbi:MAG TPA: hypothetical protein PLB91_06960 [Spirochaetales bacterium]|nr:hypothetical protein [Spirochaetales bacterium]HRY53002.1 hypothetical protein [Spirochaetia bacterium]
MAVLSQNAKLTIIEAIKAQGYDDFAAVVGDLAQLQDFLDEAVWLPTTHGSFNKAFQAKSLGKGGFSKANSAVPVIASSGDDVVEPVKLYEGDSVIDERVLKGTIDPYKVRDSQDAMNLEGCTQDWLYNLITASGGPDGFKGFMARRPALDKKTCFGFGGTASGSLSSGYMIEFGPSGFYLGYNPVEGVVPGFSNEDRGRHSVPAPDGNGNMWAWIRHYEIWGALIERNKRALIRLANINPAGGTGDFSSAPFLAAKRWQPSGGRRSVAFFSRNVAARIDEFCYSKSNAAYGLRDIQGYGPVSMVGGVPIRVIDAIPETETTVS